MQIIITALLWGSTFVLVRFGLDTIGPLTLAGLRYTTAGALLLPVIRYNHIHMKDYRHQWGHLALLGFLSFTVGNGASGLALKYLPSTTVALLTNLTSPLILLFSLIWLKEIPGRMQVFGLALAFGGMLIFFYPFTILFNNPGLVILSVGTLAFTFYSLLGRLMARSQQVPSLVQTAIPFIVGGGLLLVIALGVEGVPVISPKGYLILAWMVVFNSIIGYVLYNQALRQLSAVEVSVMLKLMPFFTALSAWLVLGERITPLQLVAMLVVMGGTLLVQMKPARSPHEQN